MKELIRQLVSESFIKCCLLTSVIEKDVVMALLPIVLSAQRAPHLNLFLEFLQTSSTVRITLDQWDSFLQFNNVVGLDLKNYEDDGAWPLLLDEYIEWRRKNANVKA